MAQLEQVMCAGVLLLCVMLESCICTSGIKVPACGYLVSQGLACTMLLLTRICDVHGLVFTLCVCWCPFVPVLHCVLFHRVSQPLALISA
jgi:hypothetical protein